MKIKLVLATAALILATSAYAERGKMYKWTDANGVVHFSEAPPASANVETERTAIPGVESRRERQDYAPVNAPDTKEVAKSDSKSELIAAMSADPALKEQMQKQCADVQRNIAVLKSEYSRVQSYDPNGKAMEMDATQRKARLEREEDYIATYCS